MELTTLLVTFSYSLTYKYRLDQAIQLDHLQNFSQGGRQDCPFGHSATPIRAQRRFLKGKDSLLKSYLSIVLAKRWQPQVQRAKHSYRPREIHGSVQGLDGKEQLRTLSERGPRLVLMHY